MSLHPYTATDGEFSYRGVLWNCYTTLDILKRVEKFQFRSSDIVVLTNPRSGTTLTQEMIWNLKHKDDDLENGPVKHIDDRFPFLEFNCIVEGHPPPLPIDILENDEDSPYRLIKTHCPTFMIQQQLDDAKCKVIFVLRNPKDTCVSMYHFYKGMFFFGPWKGDWKEFVKMFTQGYTKCGSWMRWTQICIDYVKEKMQENNSQELQRVLLLTYEDLVTKPRQNVQKMADFLDIPVSSNEMEHILDKCKFETMAKDPALNKPDPQTGFHFVRKGEIGNWRNYCDEEDNRLLDEMISKVDLKGLLTWTFE